MDFAVCKIMAKRGWADDHIAYGLRHASPDLEQRQSGREWEYTWRTVRNAVKQPDVQAARTKQAATRDDRQRLSETEPYKDRERRGAAEQPPRMGGDSSPRRQPPPPLSPLQQYQARWNAVQASFRKADASGYSGNAVREYRKELARQQLAQGLDPDRLDAEARQTIDKDIALRLLAAGYARRDVANALQRGSPEAALQPAGTHYGQWLVIQSTQTQTARQTVQNYQRWKVEQGYSPQERRLERLGLATTVEPSRQPVPPRPLQRDREPGR
jgi:hypothetical protein